MAKENLAAVWVKILRTLRENKNFALFGLLGNMDDVELINNKIILHTHNEAEKSMLKNHLSTLQKLAGTDVSIDLQDFDISKEDDHAEYISRLKDLFGDKVKIV